MAEINNMVVSPIIGHWWGNRGFELEIWIAGKILNLQDKVLFAMSGKRCSLQLNVRKMDSDFTRKSHDPDTDYSTSDGIQEYSYFMYSDGMFKKDGASVPVALSESLAQGYMLKMNEILTDLKSAKDLKRESEEHPELMKAFRELIPELEKFIEEGYSADVQVMDFFSVFHKYAEGNGIEKHTKAPDKKSKNKHKRKMRRKYHS